MHFKNESNITLRFICKSIPTSKKIDTQTISYNTSILIIFIHHIYLFIYLFIHPIYLINYLFIYLFLYLFTLFVSNSYNLFLFISPLRLAAVAERGDHPQIHVFDLRSFRRKKTLVAPDSLQCKVCYGDLKIRKGKI